MPISLVSARCLVCNAKKCWPRILLGSEFEVGTRKIALGTLMNVYFTQIFGYIISIWNGFG